MFLKAFRRECSETVCLKVFRKYTGVQISKSTKSKLMFSKAADLSTKKDTIMVAFLEILQSFSKAILWNA